MDGKVHGWRQRPTEKRDNKGITIKRGVSRCQFPQDIKCYRSTMPQSYRTIVLLLRPLSQRQAPKSSTGKSTGPNANSGCQRVAKGNAISSIREDQPPLPPGSLNLTKCHENITIKLNSFFPCFHLSVSFAITQRVLPLHDLTPSPPPPKVK